jgi:argininosuccinate lyase
LAKLWDKGSKINSMIEGFTVGKDYLLDQSLVKYDCIASKAHARTLNKAGIITDKELKALLNGLDDIIKLAKEGKFVINKDDEDCHTAIENYLTSKFGEVGKKIHTARSRNDQVLVALRLYEKKELGEIKSLLLALAQALDSKAKKNSSIPMPGYTHMQKAMPTTISTWLGCFSSAIDDDKKIIENTLELIDQCPLGSAAGYGVPIFRVDNEFTAKEAGFKKATKNPIYAQMTRAKLDSVLLSALTSILFDLNKLATDLVLFNTSEFGFVVLPKEFCTGSSIMPQKKNPDALELVRGYYHVALGEEFKQKSLVANLPSGYNREMQLTKEIVMNSISVTKDCLKIMILVVSKLKFNKEKLASAMTPELFATQEAYKLVKKGISFRQAYKEVGKKFTSK